MKRILFVLATGFFCSLTFSLLQSCDKCSPGAINHILASIQGKAQRITGTAIAADSVDTVNTYSAFTGAIRYDSVAIEVKNNFLALNANSFNWGFQSAMACEPAEHYSSLSNITVTSSAGYNANLPAGTDLRSIIQIRQGTIRQGMSVNDFLLSNKILYGSLPFYITFTTAPASDMVHDFVITYFLADGSLLKSTVKGVSIKK